MIISETVSLGNEKHVDKQPFQDADSYQGESSLLIYLPGLFPDDKDFHLLLQISCVKLSRLSIRATDPISCLIRRILSWPSPY